MVKTFTFATFLLSVSCIWGLTLDVKACLGSEETNDTVPIRDIQNMYFNKNIKILSINSISAIEKKEWQLNIQMSFQVYSVVLAYIL